MASEMTPYDRRAWDEIEKWREKQLTARAQKFVPQKARDTLAQAGRSTKHRFDKLPGAAQFESLFASALGGLVDLGSRAAMASVRDEAILKAYRKNGAEVEIIDDITKVDLRLIAKVKPNLALGYTLSVMAEGAAAGLVISGGEIVAAGGSLLGAGAGAAPGIGTVVGVMAADAAAVLVAANRAVAHTAAYYGYDLDRPDERLFALAVLSMGTATGTGKAAAYIEINKLVQMLARRATWAQLRQNAVTSVIDQVFARLGYRITQRKLGQAVPMVGTIFGAGVNARMLASVVDDADHIYRERFLRERYGIDTESVTDVADEGDVIDIAGLIDEGLARQADELPSPDGLDRDERPD